MNKRLLNSILLAGTLCLQTAGVLGQVNAPTSSSSPSAAVANQANDADPMREVVVTAQKREESAANVGLTISALSADQLQTAGVTDVTRLTNVVSGFTLLSGYLGMPSFSIRGVGFETNQLAAAPTVSVYVDEAPLPYPAMTGDVTLDLQRVEVVKGPQGTLFGNNSTGGSINFIAAKPTRVFSAGVSTTVDRFGQFAATAFVSGPLSDTFLARLAVSTTQGGDWQHTYTPGPYLKTAGADQASERLTLMWLPSDRLKVTLTENAYYDRSAPLIAQLSLAKPSGGPGSAPVVPPYGSIETYPLPPHDDRAADFPHPGSRNDKFYQGVVRVDYDLSEALTLTSLSNFSHLDAYSVRPMDGTRIDIIETGSVGTIQTYGEELRLSGDFKDIGLNTIAGVNYSHDKVSETQPSEYNNFSLFPPGFSFDPLGVFSSQATAAFANAQWNATAHVTLLGGVRYTVDKQTDYDCVNAISPQVVAFFAGLANSLRAASGLGPTSAYGLGECSTLGPAPTYLPFTYDTSSTDHNVSWHTGLNYHVTDDLMPYVSISRGYKAGGYPFQVSISSTELAKVQPEELTSYEAGIKYNPRGHLQVSTAAYYYDYTNKQVFAETPVPLLGPVSILANIPKSRAYGADADLTWWPVSQLTLHAAVNYNRTDITDAGTLHLDGFGQPIDYRGHSFAYAPVWSTTFDAQYRVRLGAHLQGVVGGNGLYNSRQSGDLSNEAPFNIDPYCILDAHIGVEADAGWKASFWVRNLTDKYYWTSANFGGDGFFREAGMPRNFGVTFSYAF